MRVAVDGTKQGVGGVVQVSSGAVPTCAVSVPVAAAVWFRLSESDAANVAVWTPSRAVICTSVVLVDFISMIRSPTCRSSAPPLLMSTAGSTVIVVAVSAVRLTS